MNPKLRSSPFDTSEINLAMVGLQDNIWIMSRNHGLLKMAPGIFDDIPDSVIPTETPK